MIRTRIAPAPTGRFHIGTARAALFNYLYAKQRRGEFILRIEDTDKARSKKEFEKDILGSLRWLGLAWDEFYLQSERISIYRKYVKKLLEEGRAIYCYHSSEETKGGVHFCKYREQSEQENQKSLRSQKRAVLRRQSIKNKKWVIRFKTPRDREVEFEDLVRGKVKFNTNEIGDFSIAKSIDEPLWILAVSVDDYEMGITHVIRGEDHISNTPKQILLQKVLGFPTPTYAHLPLILGPDRSKLSKRHGATSVSEFKEQGYLPEALINMIAFLGWNPGDEREFFTLGELVKEFSLERVKKGAAVFNKDRLDFLNQHYIRMLPIEILTERAKPFFQTAYGEKTVRSFKKLKKIISLEKNRVKTLRELVQPVDFIFHLRSYNPALLEWKDQTAFDVKASLQKVFHIIEQMSNTEYNELRLSELLLTEAGKGGGRGELLWPLRVALSGKKASPGPFEIAAVLGKKETLRRIQYAIKKIT